jgi:phosphatidylserine/phosphatidylglycerophosphate/cardiolipin synthase-like enzyme
MKKQFSAILTIISCLLISACGSGVVLEPDTSFNSVETFESVNAAASLRDPNFLTFFSNTYDGDPNIAQNFPDNPDKRFIKFVNEAKKTLDICVFEIDSKNITEAIINAHKRGVRVRMVVDSQTVEKSYATKHIRDAGIKVVDDGGRFAYMHNKFAVEDSSWVWTGSFNLTDNASWKHNDNVIKINSPFMAENYTAEFEEMFKNNKFGRTSPNNIKHRTIHVSQDKTVTTLFAPEDDVMGAIINEVLKAKDNIKFMGFSFTDDDLANALLKKSKEGTPVEGIFEYLGSGNDSSALVKMSNGNRNMKLYVKKPLQAKALMHHKVFIIDDKVTITGSFNFSKNAAFENDENVLIIYSQTVASDYSQEFEKVKNRSYNSKD